ncbi:hypothetical protein CALCODRAFT_505347 [Calocera cornea HHB12733]|uniref:Uncharacterized protein n=1 Tax=Calocera cornea HHB12733 TaxID=1353952 RepID=A0A165KCY0_9BASI|nr:hypothetical protein CALCODRAFT_505347 [Calocera cornea HHB12733]
MTCAAIDGIWTSDVPDTTGSITRNSLLAAHCNRLSCRASYDVTGSHPGAGLENSSQAQAYNTVKTTDPHQASWTHELIAGAAAYEADRAYEKHVEQNGQPASHDEAKALLAGFAGAFVDREVETRGLSFIDKERAKHSAKQQAEQGLSQSGQY